MFETSVSRLVFLSFVALAAIPVLVSAQGDSTLYEAKCGRCHVAYDPSDFSAEEWPGIVRSMKAHAALTTEDEEAITEYLHSLAAEDDTVRISYRPSLGGYLYTEYFQTPGMPTPSRSGRRCPEVLPH